ncbi:MAG: hypothetical protein ACOCRK_03345 [bacterium]
MAARKFSSYQNYTYGNTARKLHVLEDNSINSHKVIRQKRVIRRKSKNLGYKFVLFFAIVATLAICVIYLKTEMNISKKSSDIKILEQEYEKLKDNNNILMQSVEIKWDLDEVYTIATEELGMIKPDSEQIKYYKEENASYMNQYSEIENEDEKNNNVANIIGFMSQGW